jgi:hypothetical protein
MPAAPSSPVAPQKSPEVVAIEKQLSDERRIREVMLAKQKAHLEGAAKKEREGLGSKMSRLTELEKMHAQAKLNPEAFLKGVYGDDWYDRVVQTKLNGGVPTADVLASEVSRLEEKFEAKLKARDEEHAKSQQESTRAAVEQSRREQVSLAGEFWTSASKDFPMVDSLGTADQVAAEIARRREAHYDATSKRDEEGRLIAHGQVLGLQKVAELWEAQLVGLAERAAGHEKYAGKFVKQPAVAAPKHVDQQQRRTLTNDLTGSTPARSAPANDIERRQRAIAAYEAKSKTNT